MAVLHPNSLPLVSSFSEIIFQMLSYFMIMVMPMWFRLGFFSSLLSTAIGTDPEGAKCFGRGY